MISQFTQPSSGMKATTAQISATTPMINETTLNMHSIPFGPLALCSLERGLDARYFGERLVAAAHDHAADRLVQRPFPADFVRRPAPG